MSILVTRIVGPVTGTLRQKAERGIAGEAVELEAGVTSTAAATVARAVRIHALGWLVAANAVGVFLATDLIWPAWGDLLAPFTYGRWMPLHLNWQLYGWCALPLVGVLLQRFLDFRHPHAAAQARVALAAWSLALAAGGISWLSGVTSGKLFLDWSGWARPLFPIAMLVLWTVLAAHGWWRMSRSERERVDDEPLARARSQAKKTSAVFLLGALLAVPPLMYWASGREVYPSVNPHSGGATGTSLLGSTLGIVAIFGLLPVLLGLGRNVGGAKLPAEPLLAARRGEQPDWSGHAASRCGRRPAQSARWSGLSVPAGLGILFILSVAVFWRLDHGHASHRTIEQVVGLGVLIVWIPMLIAHWRQYIWSQGARPWLLAACGWWAVLVVTGWISFLPGVSEQLKFTHALVAHAHLAMAGLVTSVNFAMLNELDPKRSLRRGFWWWQGGCAAHVIVLAIAGWFESARVSDFFGSEAWTQGVFAVRLAAGIVMAAASVAALGEAGGRSETWPAPFRTTPLEGGVR